MAARHVVVRVILGEDVLEEAVRRPVRLTPDGCAGVVYAGAVYPLHAGDVVDTAGASWEIADCNRFLLVGADDLPYSPWPGQQSPSPAAQGFSGRWALETTDFGHYVVFDADERTAAGVVDLLEAGGLAVQRWDVSHRPASDGGFYDWFARLRSKLPHDELLALVNQSFAGRAAAHVGAPLAPAVRRVEDLEAKVEALLTQNLELQGRLEVATAAEAQLRERLVQAGEREVGLVRDLDRALERLSALRQQIVQLRESVEQEAALAALHNEQLATEELLELALAENSELWRGLRSAQDAADDREQQLLVLRATLDETRDRLDEVREQEREQRRSRTRPVAPRRGVEGFFGIAFARIDFVAESAEVLANLDSPIAAVRCLVQIDMGEMVGRDLEGLRGWREVSKIATGIVGSEDMGRIYYKPDGGRVLVSVHVKQDDKEQRRHLERLRSL